MNRVTALSFLSGASTNADDVMSVINFVHRYWHNASDQAEAVDLVVRLASKKEDFERILKGASRLVDEVVRFAGLFPYLTSDTSAVNAFLKKCMSIPQMPNVTFHKGQLEALAELLNGKSLVLSAPTSFGKSLLVDVLIKVKEYRVVIIVVPTLALLDEYRKRLRREFPSYKIITRPIDSVEGGKVIYLGTQERIESRVDIENVDLFIIDEFYKLDLRRKDERSASLNNVMATYAERSKQIYLLGPSIGSINDTRVGTLTLPFMKTDFSPVAVDIIKQEIGSSKREDVLEALLTELRTEQTLVYLRSPRAAYKCALDVIPGLRRVRSGFGSALSSWIRDNYHPEWVLNETVKRSVGIHHGRIPRALAQYQIEMFNQERLRTILCTSSMIEGINTKAKNVIIYDNYISEDKLDRFTYDNIKGRAGRMFQHFVGRVFLFSEAPLATDIDVEIPILNGFENASDSVLVSVPESALSSNARRRRRSLVERSQFSESFLRKWGRFGVDGLEALGEELNDRRNDPLIVWSDQGTYEQLKAVFELAWQHLQFAKHDIRSGAAAAFFTTRLRRSRTLADFIGDIVQVGGDLPTQLDIDRCLNFLRGAEFTFPQILLAITDLATELKADGMDYSIVAARLPLWFARDNFVELEEYGIPFPVAQRNGWHLHGEQEFDDLGIRYTDVSNNVERSILRRNLSA